MLLVRMAANIRPSNDETNLQRAGRSDLIQKVIKQQSVFNTTAPTRLFSTFHEPHSIFQNARITI